MPTTRRTSYAELEREVAQLRRELDETRQQQRATVEVLQVISRSTFDVAPVFETVVKDAVALCGADAGNLYTFDGEVYRLAVAYGGSEAFHTLLADNPIRLGRGTLVGKVGLERRTVQIVDVLEDPDYAWREAQQLGETRTLLGVPMLRNGEPIGVIAMIRRTVQPFTERQIELVTTFAAHGVIAINTVHLFTELQQRTNELARSVAELTALREVGQVVSSTLDLAQVLSTIVSYAVQVSGTDAGSIYQFDSAAQTFSLRSAYALSDELADAIRGTSLHAHDTLIGQAAREHTSREVADLLDAEPDALTALLLRADYRAALAVPILHENRIIGALVVQRSAPGPFGAETVRVLQTFAAQSALAIQNAELYQEIEAKNRQLEVASRHKSEFLANMSHELRTPLNAIIGFSEVLIDQMFGPLNAKQTDYLEDILASGRELLALINEILDLAKVEAGRMELELSVISLPATLEQCVMLVREQASRHAITLSLEVAPALELIEADELKLKRVVVNLLSNAVKFTPDGGSVAVVARRLEHDIEVTVTDTGPGIAVDDHERIFEEFQQIGQSALQQHEGTGLGLSLARKLVELHGGRIRVESVPGAGSTFSFTLPLRQRSSPTAAPTSGVAAPSDSNGPLILLVEDNPHSIELLRLYLGNAGFRVAVARDGEDGLALARQLRPAAIVLDILLPRLDGWEFLSRVKADEALAAIPVIIVSMLDEPGRGYALGAAKYLTKPVDRGELLAALRHVTAVVGSVEEPPRVLAIDDDPLAIELIQAVLQPEGYRVLTARSGAEGVALAEAERPAVVIVDLLMPDMDGFAVVERLHATSTTADTPIVIWTSKSLSAVEQERLMGQIAFLARKAQFSRAAFVDLVRRLVRAEAPE